MAMERPLTVGTGLPDGGAVVDLEDQIKTIEGSEYEVEEPSEDGSVTVIYGPKDEEAGEIVTASHDANLAEFLDEAALRAMGQELLVIFDEDLDSRREWAEAFTDAYDLLGFKKETRTQPWQDACGVRHPVIGEAVINFQSTVMTETFPPDGPVKVKIVGKQTDAKLKQAARVKEDMNVWLTEKMPEFSIQHERAMFSLSFAGSSFKKTYYDYLKKRPRSDYVAAEDVIANYGYATVEDATRITQRFRQSVNVIKKLQLKGRYLLGVDIDPQANMQDEEHKKRSDFTGEHPSFMFDDAVDLLEMHVNYVMPGLDDTEKVEIAKPYVFTIVESTGDVLSVYRNWREDDDECCRIEAFVKYDYIIGPGFYGYGFAHILGGLADAATSMLRQLIDSAELANLRAGFKTEGYGDTQGDSTPLGPGEFRDISVGSGPIRDNIYELQYREPSSVMAELLGAVVDEARRFASTADLKVSDMQQQAPVGTTLALLEKQLRVQTGVMTHVHRAFSRELKQLVGIFSDFPTEYDYEVEDNEPGLRQKDYSSRIDIIPVTDPNSSTMAQRVMLYDAVRSLAKEAPDLYDKVELHKQTLAALKVPNIDRLIPSSAEKQPEDPVLENMNIMTGTPVKAHPHQDHEAHIRVHMAALDDPKIVAMVARSPAAASITGAADAHIREHMAFAYRRQVEKTLGTQLPEAGQPLPPEAEVNLSSAIADAAEALLGQHQAEIQANEIRQKMEDPVVQIQQQDAETKKAETERKAQADVWRHQEKLQEIVTKAINDGLKTMMEDERARAERESRETIAAGKMTIDAIADAANRDERKQAEALRSGTAITTKAMDVAAKEAKERQNGGRGPNDD